MDNKLLNQLLKSIKDDNVKKFQEYATGKTLSLCLGRFPLLSLCYMYDSAIILDKFEDELLNVNDFIIEDEPLAIYDDFKKIAGKSLRLYTKGTRISPLEMLAIMGHSNKLRSVYTKTPKNQSIVDNLKKIYSINYNVIIEADLDKIDAPKVKNVKEPTSILFKFAIIAIAFSLLICCALGCSVGFIGLGTKNSPIKVAEMGIIKLNSNNALVLTSDLNSSDESIQLNSLNGNNHSITLDTLDFIDVLTGSLENLTFILNLDYSVKDTNTALIKHNKGTVKNVTVVVNGKISENSLYDDVYISALVGINEGNIENCKIVGNLDVIGNGEGNATYCSIAAQNYGAIKNCKTENGDLYSENVDLCGISIENYGIIEHTSNNLTIEQRGTILSFDEDNRGWNPNCAGICVTNEGVLTDCVNNGDIKGYADTNEAWQIMLGGVAITNLGTITNCINSGKIMANSANCALYLGGLVTFNKTKYVISTFDNASISGSANLGDIDGSNEGEQSGEIIIGGLVSYNQGNVSKSYNKGKQNVATASSAVYIGGLIGISTSYQENLFTANYADVNNCYSYSEISLTIGTKIAVMGGIAGRNDSGLTYNYAYTKFNVLDLNEYQEDETPVSVFTGTIAGLASISPTITGGWSSSTAYNSAFNESTDYLTIAGLLYNNSISNVSDGLNTNYTDRTTMIEKLKKEGIYLE